MIKKICEAFDCNNVIHSNRSNQKYCCPACKTRQHRNKAQNKSVATISGNKPSGNIGADMSLAIIQGTIQSGLSAGSAVAPGIAASVGNNMLGAALPYMKETCFKRPLVSAAAAVIGAIGANVLFSSCTTETKGNKKTKTCTNASGMQRASSAAIGLFGVNLLLDMLQNGYNGGYSETLQKRDSNATDTEGTANKAPMTWYEAQGN